MSLLHTRSLSETVDAVGEALFFGRTIPGEDAHRVSAWLAGRQGLPGSYAGMFAPTSGDFRVGIRLFTGERISSGAATAHILGEETCRMLHLLGVDTPEVTQSLTLATRSMENCLRKSETGCRRSGFF
ncbi:MAG: hypothetical protein A2161_07155 [Candidatus Schekmanbacteria bacterium RBG_13_48_7]|uniref:Uncharacterized protein n=1 Tax=Candidatus Schekmanbacteria bacterium RBG_13_48_7 TaxID=1817878 RepID=A0A1F7RRM5_9BACT|nr:MAG: hypothetical protein A2161_07155 [Candidatus Schekmanbacteria bacterium RBG_13_48_7]